MKFARRHLGKVHGTILHQFSRSRYPIVVGKALGADIRLNPKTGAPVYRREPSYTRV